MQNPMTLKELGMEKEDAKSEKMRERRLRRLPLFLQITAALFSEGMLWILSIWKMTSVLKELWGNCK